MRSSIKIEFETQVYTIYLSRLNSDESEDPAEAAVGFPNSGFSLINAAMSSLLVVVVFVESAAPQPTRNTATQTTIAVRIKHQMCTRKTGANNDP